MINPYCSPPWQESHFTQIRPILLWKIVASSYLTPENGDCGQGIGKFSKYVFLFRPDGWFNARNRRGKYWCWERPGFMPPVVHEIYKTNIQFHSRHGQEQSIQVSLVRTLWKRQQIKTTLTLKSKSAENKASVHNGGIQNMPDTSLGTVTLQCVSCV